MWFTIAVVSVCLLGLVVLWIRHIVLSERDAQNYGMFLRWRYENTYLGFDPDNNTRLGHWTDWRKEYPPSEGVGRTYRKESDDEDNWN